MQELFIDTEANDHNQKNLFKEAVILNKKKHNPEIDEKYITFDAPINFKIKEVLQYIDNKNNERRSQDKIQWKHNDKIFEIDNATSHLLFEEKLEAVGSAAAGLNGKLFNFISRIENKLNDKRLSFILGDKVLNKSFEEVLRQFIGYTDKKEQNVTLIDLSGIPFEVLSITVSLISRILFEYGFYSKKGNNSETPLLLVYEEAHKYVPKTELAKYNASRTSIERIAKEGRKYGVTLAIVSQRPSEISETIFSQCNNFISMRLTNPQDQNYVKRLLPDSLGPLTESLPILECGEAILIGDSLVMPSFVRIDRCEQGKEPSSNDIKYFQEWKKEWVKVGFASLIEKWTK